MKKIVSVTLSGNSSTLIGDALSSIVNWVDECILINTGITDDTITVAKKIAKEKLVINNWIWRDDFAAARNHCLDIAYHKGADYAFILDTDERIEHNGDNIRQIIEQADESIKSFHMLCSSGTYDKVRCIKIPCAKRYVGPTHEVIVSSPSYERIDFKNARFWEVPKTPEALKLKFERDIRILTKHTNDNPKDPRWHYYLGDSYKNLSLYQEAIASYERCWELDGWDEESAWSMYQAAQSWISLENYKKAIECCGKGLSRHPGIAELSWLAGWCSYKIGDYKKAIYWSKLAISAGKFEGFGNEVSRIGFRHPPAQWEGPYDVLLWSMRMLNPNEDLKDVSKKMIEAQLHRVNRL